jgi:hypothetical protein
LALSGGLIGFLMLIRPQTVIFLPILLALAGIVYRKRRLSLVNGWYVLIAGTIAMILPWMLRNAQVAGEFTLQESDEISLIGQALQTEPGKPRPEGGETETDFLQRTTLETLFQALSRPLKTFELIGPHFLHNFVVTVFVLPTSLRPYAPDAYVSSLPMWQRGWAGELPLQSWLPLLLNIFFISLGMASAWKQKRWAGMTPLVLYLGYSATTAAVRYTGRRYIMPVDWIVLIYYAIGVFRLLRWGSRTWPRLDQALIFQQPATGYQNDQRSQTKRWWGFSPKAGALLLAFFLVGSALPATERSIQPRHPQIPAGEIIPLIRSELFVEKDDLRLVEQLENFLQDEQAIVLQGRALYPQVYHADQDFYNSGIHFNELDPKPFERLGFYLIGPWEGDVFLRMDDPPAFPHASDVIVFGCPEDTRTVNAVAVISLSHPGTYLRSQDDFPLGCTPRPGE